MFDVNVKNVMEQEEKEEHGLAFILGSDAAGINILVE